jgi:hypothetical protein
VSDPASVLISTAALLAVAVMAGAHGSMRAETRELRSRIDALEAGAAKATAERAKDRAALVAVRLIVRRVRRAFGAPLPPDDPEPDPIGFRHPP